MKLRALGVSDSQFHQSCAQGPRWSGCSQFQGFLRGAQDVLGHHRTAKLTITIPGQKEVQFTFCQFHPHPGQHWRPVQGKSIPKLEID